MFPQFSCDQAGEQDGRTADEGIDPESTAPQFRRNYSYDQRFQDWRGQCVEQSIKSHGEPDRSNAGRNCENEIHYRKDQVASGGQRTAGKAVAQPAGGPGKQRVSNIEYEPQQWRVGYRN